jgi:phage terminase Nu1 subunit (DNA packaging protein)
LAKEQADGKEMENEVSRGELVHIKDVGKNMEKGLVKVRNRLLAIPTDVSQEVMTCDTVAEAQEVIERAILGALNELVGVDQGEAGETAH